MTPADPAPDRRGAGIVTLTTDFGVRSSYVGALKGALLSAAPRLTLVDLSHEVPPYDIVAAALLLEGAVPAFPPGTVHLAVVDPGVGGPRRPLVVVQGGHSFVGPDNGIFTPFLSEDALVFEIDIALAPGALSATFHGRDLFAPLAARLAAGTAPARLGSVVADAIRIAWPQALTADGGLEGVVVHVDTYGNLVTSLRAESLAALGPRLRVRVGGRSIAGIVRTYDDGPAGACVALIGSGGRLEVAVARGDAAATLALGVGAPVRVEPAP